MTACTASSTRAARWNAGAPDGGGSDPDAREGCVGSAAEGVGSAADDGGAAGGTAPSYAIVHQGSTSGRPRRVLPPDRLWQSSVAAISGPVRPHRRGCARAGGAQARVERDGLSIGEGRAWRRVPPGARTRRARDSTRSDGVGRAPAASPRLTLLSRPVAPLTIRRRPASFRGLRRLRSVAAAASAAPTAPCSWACYVFTGTSPMSWSISGGRSAPGPVTSASARPRPGVGRLKRRIRKRPPK